MRKTWFLVLVAASAACSSSSGRGPGNRSDGGVDAGSKPASNGFAGQWSCPYTTNSGFMDSTKMVFTQNPDGTLSSTSMIQNDACALSWTVSGSTATAAAGKTCGAFTVTSYTFKLEQGVAFAAATAVQHGTNIAPDGTATPIDIAGSFSGFCTRVGAPDAGTPTICEQDPAIGCGANAAGYLCLGTSSPHELNPAISCPQLFQGGSSCCTLGSGASSCHPDSTVSCTGSRSGYACAGTDTPAQAASVVCEPGKPRGTDTTYCCGTYTSPSCTLTTGCGDYAFSCSGSANPRDTDPSLRCGPPNSGFGDLTVFCCSVRDPAIPVTCAPDPTVPCSPTVGYSCTGAETPTDDDPSLVCGTPTAYQGKNLYCCRT